MVNELNYNIIKRTGEKSNDKIIKHEVETIDFMIDNNSLLKLIMNEHGGHDDYMGCFSRGWIELNKNSKSKLLLETKSDTINGRFSIYVCPECADIGCGAYCCKIEKTNELYIWKNFAYENDYEPEKKINNIGPYYFNKNEYETIIKNINSILT